jgi:hypothetical protein
LVLKTFRTTKEIIPILVEKSIGAPKTKKAAVEILLTCIEYELVDDVVVNFFYSR